MLVVGVAAGLVLAGAVRVIFGADMGNFLNLGKFLGNVIAEIANFPGPQKLPVFHINNYFSSSIFPKLHCFEAPHFPCLWGKFPKNLRFLVYSLLEKFPSKKCSQKLSYSQFSFWFRNTCFCLFA